MKPNTSLLILPLVVLTAIGFMACSNGEGFSGGASKAKEEVKPHDAPAVAQEPADPVEPGQEPKRVLPGVETKELYILLEDQPNNHVDANGGDKNDIALVFKGAFKVNTGASASSIASEIKQSIRMGVASANLKAGGASTGCTHRLTLNAIDTAGNSRASVVVSTKNGESRFGTLDLEPGDKLAITLQSYTPCNFTGDMLGAYKDWIVINTSYPTNVDLTGL